MADQTTAHLAESSPEEMAYRLLRIVASNEEKTIAIGGPKASADRKWLLDTYAECLEAVRNPHKRC
jgi:hypothetical protein